MKNYREVKIGPYSAYQIAVKHGFEGSEEDWVNGLKGKDAAIDTTLTHEGEAADAKATGDAISAVKARQNILTDSEIGNPISVDDAFTAPMCGLTVYGKSTQDGIPTPDAPVPIVSAGESGSVAVKVIGKNLIQPYEKDTQIAKNGVTMDYNVASQLVHVYGTATGVADIFDAEQKIPLFVKSDVTMSLTVRAGKIPDGVIIQYSDFVTLGLSCTGSKPYDTSAFNKPDAPGLIRFAMNIPKGTTVDFTIAVQLELGRTVTAYSPYREQLLTLPTPTGLPGVPVTSGGNYTDPQGQQWVCDEVDLERGVKVQRIGNGRVNTSDGSVNEQYRLALDVPGNEGKDGASPCIISITPYTSWTSCVAGTKLYLKNIAKSEGSFYTAEELKALAIDVDFVYQLATPIETPLAPDEIAAYKVLTAYGPDTVVQAGDGAGVKLEYQRDVNIAIKKLEDAVASMTNT